MYAMTARPTQRVTMSLSSHDAELGQVKAGAVARLESKADAEAELTEIAALRERAEAAAELEPEQALQELYAVMDRLEEIAGTPPPEDQSAEDNARVEDALDALQLFVEDAIAAIPGDAKAAAAPQRKATYQHYDMNDYERMQDMFVGSNVQAIEAAEAAIAAGDAAAAKMALGDLEHDIGMLEEHLEEITQEERAVSDLKERTAATLADALAAYEDLKSRLPA